MKKCPMCKGSGRVRFGLDPMFVGSCLICAGTGKSNVIKRKVKGGYDFIRPKHEPS